MLQLVLGAILPLLQKFIPDATERLKAEQELTKLAQSAIESEAKSESWLTRNARPYVLFVITNLLLVCVLNNIIIRPWIALTFGIVIPTFDLPPEVWTLFPLCFGIYGGVRTIDKAIETFSKVIKK